MVSQCLGVLHSPSIHPSSHQCSPWTLSSLHSLPSNHPTLPSNHLSLPSNHLSHPSNHPTLPSNHPTLPSNHPTLPSNHPTLPSNHLSHPSNHPTLPSNPPTPPQQPSYPPQQQSNPPQQPSYPPQQPSNPPQQPSYPPQQQSNPPQQPSYPPQQPSNPPQQPSYPPQQPSYPPQQPSNPPQQPSFPPQQPSYPPQQPSNPPQQPSYPPQQPSYPPQQQGVPSGGVPVSANDDQIKESTVKPFAQFDPEADCKILHTAMKGLFKDEGSVIRILAYRSNQQRQHLKQKYKVLFGKDLAQELHSDFGGNFGRAVDGLMMAPAEYDAFCLRHGIEGAGTDEKVLIEILCSRTNQEMMTIKQQYKTMFNRDLEHDVAGDTSGDFKRLLTSMLACARDENFQVDVAKANADAERLYQAGEARWGTDESVFNQILASRSFPQLRATFQAYAKLSRYDMEHVIEKEMSGHIKDGMTAVVKCVKDKSAFFAEKLYKSMKGAGTDDNTLVRVVVTRSEVDMVNIKNAFRRLYGKTLGSFIKGDTSGHYEALLLAMIREEHST
eukprot:Em0006g1280a